MYKPRVFLIAFDNNVSTFFAGQNVTGKILIESDHEIADIHGSFQLPYVFANKLTRL